MQTEIKFLYKDDSQFHWLVLINGVKFDYHTGLGHGVDLEKFSRKLNAPWTASRKVKEQNPDKKIIKVNEQWVAFEPNIDDVLNCIIIDDRCSHESFNEFCDNLGYSNDSIKALDIYRACQENGLKLRKALGPKFREVVERIDALEL